MAEKEAEREEAEKKFAEEEAVLENVPKAAKCVLPFHFLGIIEAEEVGFLHGVSRNCGFCQKPGA